MKNEHNLQIQAANRTTLVDEYYFSTKLQEIQRMRQSGKDIINLGIGSPDQAPHPEVIKTLEHSAWQNENHGYQSYKGTDALRDAFASWYFRYFGVVLNPGNEILPLMGSKEGIMHISMAFLDPGDEVLIPNPGYPTYSSVTKIVGATPVYYELDASSNWLPDLDALEQSDLSKVKLMWINYPHMPSGATATREFFEAVIAFGKRHNILICNDNPYAFILNAAPMSLLSVDGSKEIALELNSLSKSHNMPGWRMGMVAGHSHYIQQILKIKSNMDSGMFRPLQDAAVTALQLNEEWYQHINKTYLERKIIVHQLFDALKCSYQVPQSGLFVWAKVPDDILSAVELSDTLLYNTHIFVTPGFIFGSKGDRYLRISLCADKSSLEQALERINNQLKN